MRLNAPSNFRYINFLFDSRAEANGVLGGGAPPPGDHLAENLALLSEFL